MPRDITPEEEAALKRCRDAFLQTSNQLEADGHTVAMLAACLIAQMWEMVDRLESGKRYATVSMLEMDVLLRGMIGPEASWPTIH